MAKDSIKEVVDTIWPKTKKELEKAVQNAKNMISRGEEYLKEISEKSIDQTKRLSYSIKKEKLFYSLGKEVASLPKYKWSKSRKVSTILKEIKLLDKEISQL